MPIFLSLIPQPGETPDTTTFARPLLLYTTGKVSKLPDISNAYKTLEILQLLINPIKILLVGNK